MKKFHSSDWQKKLEIADHFQSLQTNDYYTRQRCKIYSEFARLIVYENCPEILSEELKTKIRKKIAERIFYSDTDIESPWNNVNRAHMQIEKMGIELEERMLFENEVAICISRKIPARECICKKECKKEEGCNGCSCHSFKHLYKTQKLIHDIENDYEDLKF
tara:strand:- start:471 stop:956 length:486 start_codon:yes stop_codon:yes gene_type:complete